MSDLLPILERVSALLLTTADCASLARQLGTVTQESRAEILVRPQDTALTQAQVVAEPESTAPAHVRLRLAAPIAAAALSAQWGTPRKPPPAPSGKRSLVFNGIYHSATHSVTVILEGGDPTTDVVLRRDVRLV